MKNILLIGLGNFGQLVAEQLNDLGHEVMAVDREEEKVNAVMPYVTDALIGDSTNEAFLASLGINNYDLCMVTISDDFQSSLETTSLLKEMGASLVIARAERQIQEKFLLRNGADAVIYPEKQVAKWAVVRYMSDNILSYMEVDEQHGIFDVRIPEEWLGKTIAELDVRKRYKINILGIKKNGVLDIGVQPDMVLNKDETLLILADEQRMHKLFFR